jgi:hypothetical protein
MFEMCSCNIVGFLFFWLASCLTGGSVELFSKRLLFVGFHNYMIVIFSDLASVCSCKDFAVTTKMIMHLWQSKKMSSVVARHQVIWCRDPASTRAWEAIHWHDERMREAAELASSAVLLDQLQAHMRPVVQHPAIDAWKKQYCQDNYGRLRRFKLLLLRGASQAGKTMRAESIFGHDRTLILNCQGLETHVPSFADVDRTKHLCVVLDEVSVKQVLGNKALMQCGPRPVSLGQSACNLFKYSVDCYQLAIVLCSNVFHTTREEGLKTMEEEDWISANIIDVPVPSSGRWFE